MRMKWWDIVVAVALAAMAGALVLSNPAPANVVVAAVSLGGILLAYLLLGRGLIARADTEQARPGLALVFLAIVGVLAAVGVAAEPNLASLQALLYPMLWMLSPSYGRAVVGSGVLALLIGVGLWVSLGPTGIDLTASIAIVAGIQALSFAFSIALGTWITRISEDGAAAKELVAQLTQAQGEVAQLSAAAGAAGAAAMAMAAEAGLARERPTRMMAARMMEPPMALATSKCSPAMVTPRRTAITGLT